MLQRLVVVFVGVVLETELVAQMQVVRIPLDALREIVEHELVLLVLHLDGVLLVACGAVRLYLLVVVADIRLREHAVELGIHRPRRLNRVGKALYRLLEALVLDVDSRKGAAEVHVLRLARNLIELLLDERIRIIARDDCLVGLVKLLGLLLVGDKSLETAFLASGLLPARVHRRLRLGVLEKLEHALVAGLQLGELLVGVARLVVALGHRVVGGDALEKRRIAVGALVRGLDGYRRMVGLARRLGGLHRGLDVVGVKGILAKELLGLGHRLDAAPLLHKPHDLHLRHLVAELRAEARLAVLAEVRDLRGPEEPARLEDVWRRGNGLHQHVDRELVTPGLKGLPAPVREVLRLLRKIHRHHETSSLVSQGLLNTPPAL